MLLGMGGVELRRNTGQLRFVSPAKSDVQSVKMSLRSHFESWIPAVAGMTSALGLIDRPWI